MELVLTPRRTKHNTAIAGVDLKQTSLRPIDLLPNGKRGLSCPNGACVIGRTSYDQRWTLRHRDIEALACQKAVADARGTRSPVACNSDVPIIGKIEVHRVRRHERDRLLVNVERVRQALPGRI